MPSLPNNEKKFIPLNSPNKKKVKIEKYGGLVCCASLASDSGSKIIDKKKQSRTLPLVTVSSASEISIANQCHDLKLPYPIKILFHEKTMKDADLKLQRYVGCIV